MKKTLSCAVLALLLVASASAQEKKWEIMGIGGAGGMYTPAVSPDDPNFMLISCDMSCSFRSLDGGKTWETIHTKQLNSSLNCRPLFVKAGVIWVSGSTPKISADKGATWRPLLADPVPWKGQVVRMAADTTDDSALLFGTDSGELWRSTDGGKTFELSLKGKVNSLLALAGKIYASIDDKLLVSKDKGAMWEELDVAASAPEAKGRGFICLAGGTANGATVLYGPLFKVGMFQSLDEGKTWKKTDEFRDCNEVLMARNQTEVAYESMSGYGGATKFFRTADRGRTWTECFKMGKGGNVEMSWVQTSLGWGYYISRLGVGVSPVNGKVAFISTQGDFYITRDGGDTWQQLMNRSLGVQPGDPGPRYACNGLEVTSSWQYLFDPNDKSRAYIAYTDIGFCRSVDRGRTWIPSTKGCPWSNTFYRVIFDPAVKGRMYAACSTRHDIPHWTHIDKNKKGQVGGVCVSDDGGINWKPLGKGLPLLPCTSVCLDPKSPAANRTLYCTLFEGGVWKSTDGGATWVDKSKGLGYPGNLHALSVQIHPKTGDLFCSITAMRENGNQYPVVGGLWKSTDGGDTWTDIAKELKLHWPANFAIRPDNPDVIYLTAATISGGREGGVYCTTDGGKSWTRQLKDEDFAATGGSGYVQCLFASLHPTKPDCVYLGTAAHGLWVTSDAGKTWKRFESLPFASVTNVTVDPVDPETIYVCTFGGGVWKGHYLP